MGNKRGEVVVDAAKFIAKGGGLLETSLDQRLGILVKTSEAAQGKAADGLQGHVKDSFDVGVQHMRFGVVELGDLRNEMEVLKRDLSRQFGAMEMSVAEHPELVNKGMELMYDVLDGGEGLVLVMGSSNGFEIPLLERDPRESDVSKQQRVGANDLLILQEGEVLRT
jgi:hypothetical protein